MTASNAQPPAGLTGPIVHGLSIDVEDYRQILLTRFRGQPGPVNESFDRDMEAVLALLEATGTCATFFVTGTVAAGRAAALRGWEALGHEVACHGWDHRPVWSMSAPEFAEDLRRSKAAIEDALGHATAGYRAPIFSIRWDNLHALETVSQLGFAYDSSIMPVRTRRYGVDGFAPEPARYQLPSGRRIVEVPLSVGRVLGRTAPISGGGHFRLFSYARIRAAVAASAQAGRPFIAYLHPDELGGRPFRVQGIAAGLADRLRCDIIAWKSNIGRAKMPALARRLLGEFRFGPLGELARQARAADEDHGTTRVLGTAR